MIISKTPINELFFTKLLDISMRSRGLASSALLFTQFSDYIDLELCNNMIRSYTNLKKHLYAVFVYTQMQKIGVLPNHLTFPAVLKSVAMLFRIELGKLIHCWVIKMGFDPDVHVNTAMVHMYCICLSVVDGRRLFDEMPDRNPVTWNALISGYVHNRKFKEAIDVFRKMQKAGAKPGEVTVVGVLSACAHLGALNQGRYIHDYIRHNRLRLNVYVGTALIDMYSKCGVVDDAEKVFHMMRVKNIYTWNVLISGYAMNGQGKAALQVFSNMLTKGFQPDECTFLGVFCASNLYVRERRWDKAGEVREVMEKKGIKKVPGCSSIEIENVVYEFKVLRNQSDM
ncbi:Pentatricopeptide repeat [Dillenia turbinata]|uniref:Pentatricopeptide repeat n=1 Tax=Dillenia turbinata TaxID=194707 RepID=A0AAN8UZK9_9MAGN